MFLRKESLTDGSPHITRNQPFDPSDFSFECAIKSAALWSVLVFTFLRLSFGHDQQESIMRPMKYLEAETKNLRLKVSPC